jgi:hypothetical protein
MLLVVHVKDPVSEARAMGADMLTGAGHREGGPARSALRHVSAANVNRLTSAAIDNITIARYNRKAHSSY